MKKWSVLTLAAILLGVAGLTVAGWGPLMVVRGRLTGEQFFRGWPTSHWRQVLSADPAQREAAIEQLESGGPQAAAVLTELLRDTRPSSSEVRWTAAELLGTLGAEAGAAEGALIDALADPDPHVRSVAATAIPKAGVAAETAVPALTELLRSERTPVLLRALSEYRAAAQSALPLLVELLADPGLDTETRWNAARTIGKVGPEAATVVPALTTALHDEAATVREHAAEALGDIGPRARAAVDPLVSVLSDPAPRVRRDAVRSLGQIGEPARAGLQEIKVLLKDPEAIVREATRNTLKAIAPAELPAEPAKPAERP